MFVDKCQRNVSVSETWRDRKFTRAIRVGVSWDSGSPGTSMHKTPASTNQDRGSDHFSQPTTRQELSDRSWKQGTDSILHKTSYRKISQSLEDARLSVKIFVSQRSCRDDCQISEQLINLKSPIPRLRDFASSYNKTSLNCFEGLWIFICVYIIHFSIWKWNYQNGHSDWGDNTNHGNSISKMIFPTLAKRDFILKHVSVVYNVRQQTSIPIFNTGVMIVNSF